MNMQKLGCLALLACAFLSTIDDASGQAWIGQAVAQGNQVMISTCLKGDLPVFPPEEIAEAQRPAEADLQQFWKQTVALRTGAVSVPPKPLGIVFYRDGKKIKKADTAFFDHHLAPSADLLLEEKPMSFARGMALGTDAEGIWRLRRLDTQNETAGYYRVKFMRILMRWQVDSIWPVDAATAAPEVKAYCVKPGDIEIAAEKREKKRAEKAVRQGK